MSGHSGDTLIHTSVDALSNLLTLMLSSGLNHNSTHAIFCFKTNIERSDIL